MAKEKLELSTSNEADVVQIDGSAYAILGAEELTMVQLSRLRRAVNRFHEIAAKTDATEEEAAEGDRLMDETARAVAPEIPDDVMKKLTPANKSRLTSFFFQRLAAKNQDGKPTPPPSASSSASTAETPKRG